MRRTLAILVLALALLPLHSMENTTYLSLSAGTSIASYGEAISGRWVFGGGVVGELIADGGWLGIGYQASALSNFDRDLPSLDLAAGLGLAMKTDFDSLFQITGVTGLSLRMDSTPIFMDCHFHLGAFMEAIASLKVSQSFSLHVGYDMSWYFLQLDGFHWRPFQLTSTLSVGFGYLWNPESRDQENYIIY